LEALHLLIKVSFIFQISVPLGDAALGSNEASVPLATVLQPDVASTRMISEHSWLLQGGAASSQILSIQLQNTHWMTKVAIYLGHMVFPLHYHCSYSSKVPEVSSPRVKAIAM